MEMEKNSSEKQLYFHREQGKGRDTISVDEGKITDASSTNTYFPCSRSFPALN